MCGEKIVPVPIYPPQIPDIGITWNPDLHHVMTVIIGIKYK